MSTNRENKKADLYRFVFGSKPLKYVVAVMMLFFLMHPVMPVFADELTYTPATSEAAAPTVSDAEEAVPAEAPVEAAVSSDTLEGDLQNPPTLDAVPTEQVEVSPIEAVVDEVVSPEAGAEETLAASSTEEVVPPPTYVEDTGVVTEPEVVEDVVADLPAHDTATVDAEVEVQADAASTTVPEPEFFEEQSVVGHTDNIYQFTKQQCVSMGKGAYHCFDVATTTPLETGETLYVAPDADGDKEIYFRSGNSDYAITSNTLDDDAPFYDPLSDSIVWHRLDGGRYQVFSYQDKHETLISGEFESSMEPHRSGNYTVWQSWIDETWQVVLFDGTTAHVISSAGSQNIAPQVEGEYVIWNVTDGVSHNVAVYEIATGLTSIIDDTEGARVYNPRFVLVYDTKFDNGDVITKGYDAETGTVVPLAAAAPIMPEKLPDSDQTGETRALLQNKSPSRDDSTEELDTSEAANTDAAFSSATSTDQALGLVIDVAQAPSEPNLVLTDFDIIVEPFVSSTSTQE